MKRGRSIKLAIGVVLLLGAAAAAWWGLRPEPVDRGLRTIVVPRASGAITIDGRLDEPAWGGAAETGAFVLSDGSAHAPLRCTARVMWDDDALYVGFNAEDRDLISPHRDRDDPIYTKDVVEIFIDHDGDGKDYVELQVSPRGVIFDARFPSYRKDLARSQQWNAPGLRVAVQRRGTLADDAAEAKTDDDEGWTAEFRILFDGLRFPKPTVGTSWRVNLFRIDVHEEGAHYTAWTPPLVGDFHALDRFGTFEFGP